MLSDIYNVQTGQRPRNLDVHRHALFSCAVQRFWSRLLALFERS